MAEKSKINLLVQILLLASVVFFGITLTNALDRNRCEMAELRKTIAAMPQRQVSTVGNNFLPPPAGKSW